MLYTLFSSVLLLSHVRLFATPWTAACQASLSITNSGNLPKLMSIESVMPSNHLILCRPLLLLPSIFLSIRVFSNESALCIRWPKYWNFSFSISPSNEHPGLISFRMDCLDLLAVQGTLQESSPTPQFKSISSSALSFLYSPTLTSIHDYWKNHSLDLMDLYWQSKVIYKNPIYSIGLDKYIVTFIHHHSNTENSLTVLKTSPVLRLFLPLSPPTPGNHCLHSFAFSRMSYRWTHRVCTLFRQASFT